MLFRTVQMTFAPQHVESFLKLFAEAAPRIRAVPGCGHLELWQDARYPNVLTTYSRWDAPAALEAYRSSALFRDTWARTKPLFAAAPRAFSHTRLDAPDAD